MAERSRVSRATAKHAQRRRWEPSPEQRERMRLREAAWAAAEEERRQFARAAAERRSAPAPRTG